MAPMLDRVTQEYGDQVEFIKVDSDLGSSEDLMAEYDIRSIPTLVLLDEKGQVVGSLIGQQSESKLRDFIESGLTN